MLVAVTFIKKSDPVLNVTDPTAQKRGTDGRCLTLVLLASLSVLLQNEQGLGTVIMGIFDEEKIFQNF